MIKNEELKNTTQFIKCKTRTIQLKDLHIICYLPVVRTFIGGIKTATEYGTLFVLR